MDYAAATVLTREKCTVIHSNVYHIVCFNTIHAPTEWFLCVFVVVKSGQNYTSTRTGAVQMDSGLSGSDSRYSSRGHCVMF